MAKEPEGGSEKEADPSETANLDKGLPSESSPRSERSTPRHSIDWTRLLHEASQAQFSKPHPTMEEMYTEWWANLSDEEREEYFAELFED